MLELRPAAPNDQEEDATMTVINTNMQSINAQRNLFKTQKALDTSLQRLSSGLRLNSAKDDAAGIAISQRFTAQIRGQTQAIRNANDGNSLVQIAESSLVEATNNLQRIRELSVQSANATFSASDREALQQEVSELILEIDRVGKNTNFNGIRLLDGSFSDKSFQTGDQVGDVIKIAGKINTTKAGLQLTTATASSQGTAVTGVDLIAGDLTINGLDVGAVDGDAKAIADKIATLKSSLSATAVNEQTAIAWTTVTAPANQAAYLLKLDGNAVNLTYGANVTADDVAAAINEISGYTASVTAGALNIAKADGSNFTLEESGTAAAATGLAAASTTYYGTVNVTSTDEALVVAGNTPAKAGLAAISITQATNTLSVETVEGAEAMILAVDKALDKVNSNRASLGAVQNRFDSVVTSLQTSIESLTSARSRVLDADFAQETANLTKNQILQQAGIAMLSQANQLPQNILSLLR
jgi:flagellin